MYDLVNIFDVFLPQLLHDPNPKDPLNGDAAFLLLNSPEKYILRVKEYVKKYALREKSTYLTKSNFNQKEDSKTNTYCGLDKLNKEAVITINDNNSIVSYLSNASDINSDKEVKIKNN